jgi:hypothetical protein
MKQTPIDSYVENLYKDLKQGKFNHLTSVSCHEFRLHNDSVESLVTRGLSPLPVCVLDN